MFFVFQVYCFFSFFLLVVESVTKLIEKVIIGSVRLRAMALCDLEIDSESLKIETMPLSQWHDVFVFLKSFCFSNFER